MADMIGLLFEPCVNLHLSVNKVNHLYICFWNKCAMTLEYITVRSSVILNKYINLK